MINMEIRDDYKFLRVEDAFKALHLNISLIGVIVELDFPTASDCSCTLRIIDPWHSGSGLPVKFIARTNRALPRVESIGDIIFLSNVKIVLVNRKITALCNETSSSFALFNGKHGEGFVPYQSSPKFRIREQDKSFLSSLREWMITYKFEDGSCCFTSLKDIKEGEYLNLNCQVDLFGFFLSFYLRNWTCSGWRLWSFDIVSHYLLPFKIVHVSKDDKDRCYIFVWDGTEMPPCSFVVKSERLPLCVEPEMLPTHVLRTFPTFGSVLRIIVENVTEKQAIQPGQHVKFLNLFLQVNMGLWSATFSPSTKMQYTMSRETQSFSPQREKFSSRWNPITRCISSPSHSGITGVAHEDAPFVTLMDMLTYSNVTAKFRCVVRFIQVFPRDVRNFHDLNGKFKLLAILEDATARIHASLYADEGDKFFGCDPSDEEALIKKLNKLLGGDRINEAPRNPPWVQCCLFSYYRVKNDQWGSRRFRIFDTWINAK
ncbi:protection of telomeres protein 1b isoform X2 [Brassica rapa]|uniref:protection of telomeres protein 1b isoform X2 n=1 Tax=Brassica campestris TaxID=3711 RepID=UPI00142E2463|nr:protection of telomeres protein 1b isoform X2 [Brassica rapa]